MVLAGLERLLIEQIRINNELQLGWGMHVTQAEILAAAFIVIGSLAMARLSRRPAVHAPQPAGPARPAMRDAARPEH